MNKLLPSLFLIVVGNFLEIYYYSYRFTNDNIPLWLAIVIGIGLTGLLTIATAYRKKPTAWILISTLIAYSIFATSAGQAFSLVTGQEQKAIKAGTTQIEKLEDDAAKLDDSYNTCYDRDPIDERIREHHRAEL